MRFETLDWEKQCKVLNKLHTLLNRNVFGGELNEIPVSIENLNNGLYQTPDCYGVFFNNDPATKSERIILSLEFMDRIIRCRTQKEQRYCLVMVLLHEMIHQYCYEKGIDDRNHNNAWINEAKDHWLVSDYKDGEIISEELDSRAMLFMTLYFDRF